MLYLDSNDVSPVDIQPTLHFGEKNSKPVADCLDVIWSRRKQINGILKFREKKRHVVGSFYTCVRRAKYDVWFLKQPRWQSTLRRKNKLCFPRNTCVEIL